MKHCLTVDSCCMTDAVYKPFMLNIVSKMTSIRILCHIFLVLLWCFFFFSSHHIRITEYKMSFWKQQCFSRHWQVSFLLYLKNLHVTAVTAEGSLIRQAFETDHKINDKPTSNPRSPFQRRTIHEIEFISLVLWQQQKVIYNTINSRLLYYFFSVCVRLSRCVFICG